MSSRRSSGSLNSEVRKLPFEFNDLCIGPSDFIYTVTSTTPSRTGQVKKLSPGGDNVLTYKGSYASYSAEYYRFGDLGGFIRDTGTVIVNRFVSIDIDEREFMYVLDAEYGKVFVYDTDCNLISAFGGGLGSGNQVGTFRRASSLVVNGEDLLVSDLDKGTLTVFSRTPFGRQVLDAQYLTLQGEYEASLDLWQRVSSQDRYLQLAYRGMARAEFLSGDTAGSMAHAYLGADRDTYALSYEIARREFISRNFAWLFLPTVILLALLAWLIRYSTKHAEFVLVRNGKLRVLLNVLVHPIDSFQAVKYRQQGSVLLSAIVLFLLYAVSTARDVYGGFLFTSYDPYQYSSLFTLLGTVGLLLLWVVANWGVSTLLEGKGRMKEIFIVSSYSLLPVVLARAVLLVLSYVLLPTEAQLMTLLSNAGTLAMGLLVLLGTMVVHEYSFPKSIGTAGLSILGVALMVFLIVLILTLFQDVASFFTGIFWEVAIRRG